MIKKSAGVRASNVVRLFFVSTYREMEVSVSCYRYKGIDIRITEQSFAGLNFRGYLGLFFIIRVFKSSFERITPDKVRSFL